MTLNIRKPNFVVYKGEIRECMRNINIGLLKNFPGREKRTSFGKKLGRLEMPEIYSEWILFSN